MPRGAPKWKILCASIYIGAISQSIETMFHFPITTLRTMYAMEAVIQAQDPFYTTRLSSNIIDSLLFMTRKAGVSSLYQGYNAWQLGQLLSRVIYVVAYLKIVGGGKAHTIVHVLNVLTYPIQTICLRQMAAAASGFQYESSWKAAFTIFQREGGVRALFLGCSCWIPLRMGILVCKFGIASALKKLYLQFRD